MQNFSQETNAPINPEQKMKTMRPKNPVHIT